MLYSSFAKLFSCKYCNSVIHSDKVWMADRHVATTLHGRNLAEYNRFQQTERQNALVRTELADNRSVMQQMVHEMKEMN
jgi:hypothetical protein